MVDKTTKRKQRCLEERGQALKDLWWESLVFSGDQGKGNPLRRRRLRGVGPERREAMRCRTQNGMGSQQKNEWWARSEGEFNIALVK